MYNKILYHIKKVDRLERGEIVAPISCELDPTNACQNSCHYCISRGRKPAEMEWEFYLPLIQQLKAVDVQSIVFVGGGEPTLHPLFSKMVEAAHDLGFKLGLITNGIELRAIPVEKFEYIRVSLDAGDSEAYKKIKGIDYFDRVVSNIQSVRPRCKTLGINYVICGQTASDILKAEELSDKLDVNYIHFKPVIGSNNVKPQTERAFFSTSPPNLLYSTSFYSEWGKAHPKGCMIAALAGTVTADGRYVYCCLHRDDDGFTVADLKHESLESAIEKRASMKVDTTSCPACRYYGYYETYMKMKPTHIYDYHGDFI